MEIVKLCKDCKYFKRTLSNFFMGACFNVELINLGRPVFDGVYSIPLKIARGKGAKCGPDAIYFEEKLNEKVNLSL